MEEENLKLEAMFLKIFKDEQFFLPLRWDGINFQNTLHNLFSSYQQSLIKNHIDDELIQSVILICRALEEVIDVYLKGYPFLAFFKMDPLMKILMSEPLNVYQDSSWSHPFEMHRHSLRLYRMVNVDDIKNYSRSRVFHTPYTLRSKIPTSRYSIAGFPSLYLSTDLELCFEELGGKLALTHYLAARFEINQIENLKVKIIELGIKPQDFFENKTNRRIDKDLLKGDKILREYILWYPLIAASSFARPTKKDPFAVEYILPQLLMQWIRKNSTKEEFYGIRYFSCASLIASNMGFNYIFPTSGEYLANDIPYCLVLGKLFKCTKPYYLHDYASIKECQEILNKDSDLKTLLQEKHR